jgi:CIC family chloride channel protein
VAFSRRFSALNATAILVGLLGGLAAVGFRGVTSFVRGVAFDRQAQWSLDESGDFFSTGWGYFVVLIPLAGGVLIGVIRYFFPETRRQGIAEVMAAVQARGGIIKGRTAWGHALISAITVGTGGSSGREGPIGYIGAAFGSSLARRFGFRPRDIKVLLGAGVAAGIAATFNAPLGGVLFAMELILPEFSTHAFIPVVIATVVAVTFSQLFLGDQPSFLIPEFDFVSPYELGFYLLLGVLCGIGGVFFIKTLGRGQRAGERLPLPYWAKPAVGGLVVGVIGLAVLEITSSSWFGGSGQYHVFGTGYATVNQLLQGDTALMMVPVLVLLIFAKPLASAVTIGSGGGGGVFSSSLYQGALMGGLVGLLANLIMPAHLVAPPSAYALVGMGAFYASAGRATLTTIVLMTELTDGYTVVLPIMFAAVTADAISLGLSKFSVYTVRLEAAGIHFEHDRTQSPLDTVQVRDCMSTRLDTLPSLMPVADAFDRMTKLGHSGFPAIDEEGAVIGVLTRADITRLLGEGEGSMTVGDAVSGILFTACPDDYLHKARDRIMAHDIGRLLIVDPKDRTKLVGILTRSDILRAEAEKDVEHYDGWTPKSER